MTEPLQLTRRQIKQRKKEEKKQSLVLAKKKRILRSTFIWFGVLILIGGGFYGVVRLASNSDRLNISTNASVEIRAHDHYKGPEEAKVILIEYSDLQCPACKFYYLLLKQLHEDFSELKIVYRHFPLKSIHRNAETAARATEAAGIEGKFWEMHDLLFERQEEWSNIRNSEEVFADYAKELGLDVEKFKINLNSKEIKNLVENDLEEGKRNNVNATPTFFLNGRRITNPSNYDDFRQIIESTLNSKGEENS